jgi:hypothetical protein
LEGYKNGYIAGYDQERYSCLKQWISPKGSFKCYNFFSLRRKWILLDSNFIL